MFLINLLVSSLFLLFAGNRLTLFKQTKKIKYMGAGVMCILSALYFLIAMIGQCTT
jgi:hypothetical protein